MFLLTENGKHRVVGSVWNERWGSRIGMGGRLDRCTGVRGAASRIGFGQIELSFWSAGCHRRNHTIAPLLKSYSSLLKIAIWAGIVNPASILNAFRRTFTFGRENCWIMKRAQINLRDLLLRDIRSLVIV